MTGYIYRITNSINKKNYIGQTINIKKRSYAHKSASINKNNKCYNFPLYKAIRKYGIDNFEMVVIDSCEYSIMNDKEKYWILKYQSYINDFGYNLTLGGDHSAGGIPHQSITNIMNDLQHSHLSGVEIGLKYSISDQTVSDINNGRSWHILDKYPIRERKVKEIYVCKCGNAMSQGAIKCMECHRKIESINIPSKHIIKKEIMKHNFSEIGRIHNVSDNAVRKWCRKYNLPFTKKGVEKIRNAEVV